MKKKIQALVEAYFSEIQAIRHHLHAHPELSYQEENTSKFIRTKLDQWGISYQFPVATNGIVAMIHGEKEGRVRALRADIDALPIQEENEVSYKSTVQGVMHACGHDVHTSSALGACKILHELRADLGGTIKVLFQPAEEKLPGGASIMIADGALENPKPINIIGQHVHPPLRVGKVGMRKGTYMASADEIRLTVHGKGGHAALPQNIVDPIIVSASILLQLQQVVSRQGDPTIPSVLSFGKINSVGGATNIIPKTVHIEGTFRTMNEGWRKKAHESIKRIASSVAESMGASCEVDIMVGYPCLYNDPDFTDENFAKAVEYLGEENVVELPIRLTAEDFAFYSQQIPACFYRLGTGNVEKGLVSPVHTPTFDIDEEALKVGMGLMAWLAV